MLKFSADLACVTGVILAAGVTAINWAGAETELYYLIVLPYFRLAAYLAAVLLAGGGVMTLARLARGPVLLAGAWGFVLGMSFLCIAPYLWISLNLKEDPEMVVIIHSISKFSSGRTSSSDFFCCAVGPCRSAIYPAVVHVFAPHGESL